MNAGRGAQNRRRVPSVLAGRHHRICLDHGRFWGVAFVDAIMTLVAISCDPLWALVAICYELPLIGEIPHGAFQSPTVVLGRFRTGLLASGPQSSLPGLDFASDASEARLPQGTVYGRTMRPRRASRKTARQLFD